jgi:hypothetical protein
VKRSKDFHDKFILLEGKTCNHIGASITNAGQTAFMVKTRHHDDPVHPMAAISTNVTSTTVARLQRLSLPCFGDRQPTARTGSCLAAERFERTRTPCLSGR